MSLLRQDCSLLLYACLGCTCLVSAFVVASGLVVALPPPLPLAQLKNINSGNLPLQIRRKMYQACLVCTVPVYRRRVATEQRNIRAEKRAARCWALPASDFVGVVRGQCVGTCVFHPRQVPFYPVTSRTLFRSPGPLLS